MSVPNAANGGNGVDTQCGSPGINPVFTKGGGRVEPVWYGMSLTLLRQV